MKWEIYSTSKRPEKSLEKMFEEIPHFLWHRFDSAEWKEWELASNFSRRRNRRPHLLFRTFYEGTDMEHHGPNLFASVITFLGKRGFKVEYAETTHDK